MESSDKMTHALRLTVPTLVLVLGFGSACLFRRPIRSTEVSPAGDHATFSQTRRGSAGEFRMEVPGTPGAAAGQGTNSGAQTKVVGSTSREGRGAAAPVGVPGTGTRRHRVVDGDSLRSLAARYLGDAGRANEIFQANRKRLANPDALPIGVELEIPSP